VKPRR